MNDTTPSVRTFIAGSSGMVGSAILRRLQCSHNHTILTRTKRQLDLRDYRAVNTYFEEAQPDCVIIAAAKVGGIYANQSFPADFIYDNLAIELNIVKAAFDTGVERLIFLGSSCIYPKMAVQPIRESELLSGHLEPTNDAYAIAKIAGIKLCEAFNRQHGTDYRSLMPTNLYGKNDNFHPENSHVIPGMMRRFHEAKLARDDEVVVWGTGTPRREFLHVDDLADAVNFLMELPKEQFWVHVAPQESHVNLGTGQDISIANLAQLMKDVVGFEGRIAFDDTKPDGTPRKLLDVSKLTSMGWQASITLERGLKDTYQWFQQSLTEIRSA